MMLYQQYWQYFQYLQYMQYLQQLQFQYRQGQQYHGRYAPYAAQEYSQSYSPVQQPYGQYYGYQHPGMPPQVPQKRDVLDFYKPPPRLALPSQTDEDAGKAGDYSYQYEKGYDIAEKGTRQGEYGGPSSQQKKGFTVEQPIQGPMMGDALPMDSNGQGQIPKEESADLANYREEVPEEAEPEIAEVPDEEGILEVLCFNCENPIPIYTDERPLIITCPHCGQEGEID